MLPEYSLLVSYISRNESTSLTHTQTDAHLHMQTFLMTEHVTINFIGSIVYHDAFLFVLGVFSMAVGMGSSCEYFDLTVT